jgi:hypothetical protein
MRHLSMPVELSVDELVGYASSWSAYSIYRKKHPDRPDPLVEYKARLTAALERQVSLAGLGQLHWLPHNLLQLVSVPCLFY